VLIEFVTDPNVLPIPPHITWDQVKAFMGSLTSDPERSGILRQAMRRLTNRST